MNYAVEQTLEDAERRLRAYHARTRGAVTAPACDVEIAYDDGETGVWARLEAGRTTLEIYGRVRGRVVGTTPIEAEPMSMVRRTILTEALLFANLLPANMVAHERILVGIADAVPVRLDVRYGLPVDLWLHPDGKLLCAAIVLAEKALSYRPRRRRSVTSRMQIATEWSRSDDVTLYIRSFRRSGFDATLSTRTQRAAQE